MPSQTLLAAYREVGETAYPEAAYNLAYTYWLFGRVLNKGGQAESALEPLADARRRFEALAKKGDCDAERMASVAITESADCLADLERLDEAAVDYQEAMELDEKMNRTRDVAANKFQLGSVRMLQGRNAEALALYEEVREIVEALGEPGTVAGAWHQIGMVHKKTGQYDQAAQAYRQSLAIRVQHHFRQDEAASVGELGNLYNDMGRLEEAVNCYRQAADLYAGLQDPANEGRARNNLADTLIQLGCLDQARPELLRTIECRKPYGYVAKPWKTWAILHDLEQAAGRPREAQAARQQAMESFLAYRRAGGENQSGGGQLCATVAQAIHHGETEEAERQLTQLAGQPYTPDYLKPLIPKLQSLLAGQCDSTLADNPALHYSLVAELHLLLERLGQS